MQRRWTILIVPPGSDATRTFSMSRAAVRATLGIGIAAAILLVAAGAVGGVWLGAPTGGQSSQTRRQAAEVRDQLRQMQDTIDALGRRDSQIRMLAGLPPAPDDSPSLPRVGRQSLLHPGRVLGQFATGARSDVGTLIRRANVLAASFAAVSDSVARNVDRMASLPSIMPTAGWLTSNYSRSRFHPILHVSRPHEGIDVAATMGAPIVSPASGRVTFSGEQHGYGYVVEIDHGYGIVTKYAHCSRLAVQAGQQVTRGEVIAWVGSTGLSTGPHLHYEIHVNGRSVDPLTYVLSDAIPD